MSFKWKRIITLPPQTQFCHKPNSTPTLTHRQLKSIESGLTQKYVCTPSLTTTRPISTSIIRRLHKCIAMSVCPTRFMWKWSEAFHFQEIWQDSLSFRKPAQDFSQLGENAELIIFVTSFTWKWHDSSSFLLAKQGSHLQGIEFLACMALKFCGWWPGCRYAPQILTSLTK